MSSFRNHKNHPGDNTSERLENGLGEKATQLKPAAKKQLFAHCFMWHEGWPASQVDSNEPCNKLRPYF